MPINDIKKNMRLPVIGKIRLGVRKKTQKNKDYPSETEHFVLTDVPEVADVYGESPTELDIYFPSDDENVVIPHWYKWYSGGVRGKDGNIIGGKLQCYGDGETASFLAKKDPVTGEVPTRPCLVQNCPDWKDEDGNQKCKPSMQVFFILPRVSILGVYQIDTTSWNSIRSFVSQVELIKQSYGKLTNIPFKIFREATTTTYIDKNHKEQSSVHYIMKIKPNEKFLEKYGHEVDEKLRILQPRWKPAEENLIEQPMEDHFPVKDQGIQSLKEGGSEVIAQEENELSEPEQLAEDQELAPLFTELCQIRGVSNTKKTRLLTARKFEESSDIKEELRAYLKNKIEEAKASTAKEGAISGETESISEDEDNQSQSSSSSSEAEGLI